MSRWWIVTFCATSAFGKSGRCSPTGSSKESLPCSASCATAMAVNIFVIDPRLNFVSAVFAMPSRWFASP